MQHHVITNHLVKGRPVRTQMYTDPGPMTRPCFLTVHSTQLVDLHPVAAATFGISTAWESQVELGTGRTHQVLSISVGDIQMFGFGSLEGMLPRTIAQVNHAPAVGRSTDAALTFLLVANNKSMVMPSAVCKDLLASRMHLCLAGQMDSNVSPLLRSVMTHADQSTVCSRWVPPGWGFAIRHRIWQPRQEPTRCSRPGGHPSSHPTSLCMT